MVYIARFVRTFFYFWLFGLISVLLDLDHAIQVYQDGMELNLENLAYHGTRSLHIPILIISGCFCIITAALLLRFLHLNKNNMLESDIFKDSTRSNNDNTIDNLNPHIMLNIAANTMISTTKNTVVREADKVLVECPGCNRFFGVITIDANSELSCPHCGIIGIINSVDY